ncbi:hypothetical protein DFJ74DRAFT_774925 [Hyaloraphidium curvatum]|nr:hypothetical protein DFJ74DRAFT_774925 [Hyaloraphidium curvatum]
MTAPIGPGAPRPAAAVPFEPKQMVLRSAFPRPKRDDPKPTLESSSPDAPGGGASRKQIKKGGRTEAGGVKKAGLGRPAKTTKAVAAAARAGALSPMRGQPTGLPLTDGPGSLGFPTTVSLAPAGRSHSAPPARAHLTVSIPASAFGAARGTLPSPSPSPAFSAPHGSFDAAGLPTPVSSVPSFPELPAVPDGPNRSTPDAVLLPEAEPEIDLPPLPASAHFVSDEEFRELALSCGIELLPPAIQGSPPSADRALSDAIDLAFDGLDATAPAVMPPSPPSPQYSMTLEEARMVAAEHGFALVPIASLLSALDAENADAQASGRSEGSEGDGDGEDDGMLGDFCMVLEDYCLF